MKNAQFNKDALTRLLYWIKTREAARIAKGSGQPRPWTKDPIISKYRFCNVRRNDDRVTEWIHQNWLIPYAGDPNLWFAMVVARLVNWPDTLDDLTGAVFNLMRRGRRRDHEVMWNPVYFVDIMHHRRDKGHKVFSGAYIVSTNGNKMDKAEYLATRVLDPLWAARANAMMHNLQAFHGWLTTFDGMGSFMAGQVVADIKYDTQGSLYNAEDWLSFAVPGPGSLRGMARLIHGDCDPEDRATSVSERHWRAHFDVLRPIVTERLPNGMLDSAQDLQNCLCEFDKYERVRLGQGAPRALYTPHGE